MEVTYASKAIILKTEPWNDVDSRVSFFTEKQGKLELIARGTKKLTSKLAGHLQPFNLVDLMVINGKQLAYAGAVVSLDCYPDLKQDLDKLASADYVMTTTSRLLKTNQPEPEIFDLLKKFLMILEKIQSEDLFYDFLAKAVIVQLLGILGYQPDIEASSKKLVFLNQAVWSKPWSADCWRNVQLVVNYDLVAVIKQLSLQRTKLKETNLALKSLINLAMTELV